MPDLHSRGGIRVRDLLDTAHLKFELIAGESGLDRVVEWTHVSDLEEPWIWLDGGELLLVNGLAIPPDAKGQMAFISGLASKRTAGLAIGVRAPTLRREAIALADELDFPLLRIPNSISFLSITRLVADHNQDRAQRRMATHIRLFDTLGRGFEPANIPGLVERLENISGYRLFITTPQGHPLLPGIGEEPPAAVVESLALFREDPDRRSRSLPGWCIVPIPLDARTAGFVLALEQPDREQAGLVAVRHIATIAALLASNLYRERELDRRRGAELLGRLLAGSLPLEEVGDQLRQRGLETGPLAMVKLRGAHEAIDEADHRACDLGIPHLLLSEAHDAYLVMEDARETLLGIIGDLDLVGGSSSSFAPGSPWVLARAEADQALERALRKPRAAGSVLQYSAADSPLEWLPSDPVVLRALSDEVLRPLRDYDREHNGSLLESLRVYFEQERRLSVASDVLFVHKHTLAYRLKRIEAITGRNLNEMDDLCVLYLALKASEASPRRAAGEGSRSGT
ncbi:PucR family transcriptional regulator [Conexibacter woesei]|uniref:Transcriptional regulator, PucR family n=1 Tax=Conexibacter woesei (strain DSM 14684 / CCUG 47730 / CIP 108061 / JCM 11494 / NBRC 100937 / ID131577) TaxID=469383 RepID=D3F896_CONWI|nr:PucR family transcriptional regulator [Conexibacter woesei]ADB48966.1 transcriptional regulator, PucR family [Conexibacter woesei DSM 14684]